MFVLSRFVTIRITIGSLSSKIYTSTKKISIWRKINIEWFLFVFVNFLWRIWTSAMIKKFFLYCLLSNKLKIFLLLNIFFPDYLILNTKKFFDTFTKFLFNVLKFSTVFINFYCYNLLLLRSPMIWYDWLDKWIILKSFIILVNLFHSNNVISN